MLETQSQKYPILFWENLEIGYPGGTSLIYPFSGQISHAGIYAIVGQNGCGKSTLLKTWLGLIPPLRGKLSLQNSPISTQPGLSHGVAYVPQFHAVNKYFHISVVDFIKQGFGPNHKMTEDDKFTISQLLVDWQIRGGLNQSFHELSGGQKVRCMLVRAIVSKPKILFLDEPLASLDVCCQHQLMETLDDMVLNQGVTVLMVDHHLDVFSNFITHNLEFHRHHDDVKSSVQMI